MTTGRGCFAHGNSEAGQSGHDQGGDQRPFLRKEGRDQEAAGGGREVQGQPHPLYPQSSYSGEPTKNALVK